MEPERENKSLRKGITTRAQRRVVLLYMITEKDRGQVMSLSGYPPPMVTFPQGVGEEQEECIQLSREDGV